MHCLVSGIEDVIGHHGRHWWMHKLTEFNAKHINPIFTRDSWRLPDQEIIDIYHRYALCWNFHNLMTSSLHHDDVIIAISRPNSISALE